ncbi:MAG TPA: Crp/Fnr family transcriptional regulator [Chitinophagaceae bacterium]
MFEVLQAYFERSFPLSEADIAIIHSVFQPKNMQKGECLVREGEPARYGAFVCKGILRSYIIDDKGKEHILQFAPENWWISPGIMRTSNDKSPVFIDAIEDADVLLINKEGHQHMIEKIPAYGISFREGIQKRNDAKDKRIAHALSSTAEERYNDFMESYSAIAQRLPLHMVASYLGITPETLSRIRRRALNKK